MIRVFNGERYDTDKATKICEIDNTAWFLFENGKWLEVCDNKVVLVQHALVEERLSRSQNGHPQAVAALEKYFLYTSPEIETPPTVNLSCDVVLEDFKNWIKNTNDNLNT